jgi:hypothetical protein
MGVELKHYLFYHQEGANECWFACYLMALASVEGNIEGQEKYSELKEQLKKADYFKKLLEFYEEGYDPFKDGAEDAFLLNLLQKNVNKDYTTGTSRQGIEASLRKGYPVIMGINNPQNNVGHFCVIIGIADNGKLRILNPLRKEMVVEEKEFDSNATYIYMNQ